MAERRRREDDAPRLSAEVPDLQKLDLEISDAKGESDPATTHVRRVVVAAAPAMFEIPCADPSCKDGGHVITHAVLSALRARQTSFRGDDICHGSLGSATCGRTMSYHGIAEYLPRTP